MAKTDFKSIDEYIATFPPDVQATLQRVRTTIRKAVPKAEEAISYQIPTFKLHGSYVVYFAGWKQHYSLYPARQPARRGIQGRARALRGEQGHDSLPPVEAGPGQVDRGIAKFLAKEADARAMAEGARPEVTTTISHRAMDVRSGLRRDPVLAAFLVFALVVTAFDVLAVALAPFDLPAVRHLQERVVPYTGWFPACVRVLPLLRLLGAPDG
jgi:uncharacterized protein YdhG (YjbR/CyaY superfamily)